MKKSIIALIALLLLANALLTCAFAQSSKANVKKAEDLMKENDYKDAIALLEPIADKEKDNERAIYMLAICYANLESPAKAIELLEGLKGKEIADKEGDEFVYWTAFAYYRNLQLDKASASAAKVNAEKYKFKDELADLKSRIKVAQKYQTKASKHTIENLGSVINTDHREYSSILSKDHHSILFTTRRKDNKGGTDVQGDAYEDILSSKMDQNDVWSTPTRINRHLTNKGHDATVQLFDDDKKMITYHDSDLYLSNWENNEWGKPHSMHEINDKSAQEAHCFVSPDGNTIYFSSSRESSNETLDLFVIKKGKDGKWGEAQALKELNTAEYDEDSPFMDENGTLYFSSNGPESMGGYDIFYAKQDKSGRWSKPVNMGQPLNSVYDDIYFTVNEEIAYFTSNRPGGFGAHDIYRAYLFEKVKLIGTVYNRTDKTVVASAEIRFEENGKSYTVLTNAQGNYEIEIPFNRNYGAKVFAESQLRHEEKFFLKLALVNHNDNRKDFYIEYEKAVVKKDPDPSIEPKELPSFRLEGQVRDASNQKPLTARVLVFDLGTREQLADLVCDAEGRYSIKLKSLPSGFEVVASYNGYLTSTKTLNTNSEEKKYRCDLELGKAVLGSIVRLRNIYFDFNTSIIKQNSFAELDKAIDFLRKNPSLRIEIGGHTDHVGSVEYNQGLSERRANAVRNYFVKQGIEASRLEIKGYGELQPIATNDDEEEGRELNRRMELKIIGL